MRTFAWSYPSSLYAAVLVGATMAHPAPIGASTPAARESASTTITADRMTVRNQDSKAIFEGSVVLTKGTLVVHSDAMVVSFKPTDQASSGGKSREQAAGRTRDGATSEKGTRSGADELPVLSNRSVSMIEATGRVVIERAEGRATCRKAVYYENEDKIVLTGDPVAWQKGTRVTGKKITMYLAEDRSVVEGGSRVRIEQEGSGR